MNKITRNIIGTSLAMMTMAATALDANQFINYMLNPSSAAGVPGMGPNGAPADWQKLRQEVLAGVPNMCAGILGATPSAIGVVFGPNDPEYTRIFYEYQLGIKINQDHQSNPPLQATQNCQIQYYRVKCIKLCTAFGHRDCDHYYAVIIPTGTGTRPGCTPQP